MKIALDDVLAPGGRLDLNPEIERGDYFSVSLRGGSLTLRAGGYIGLIPVNDRLVVQVVPRVPMSSLHRVISISGYPPTILTSLRGYETHGEWNDSLLDLYAKQLIDQVERIGIYGLARSYERREGVSSFPRGRIAVHRTVQRQYSRGTYHQVSASWFERTSDVPVNRCVKYAIFLLARRYQAAPSLNMAQRMLLRRLNGIYGIFRDVALEHNREFLHDDVVTGARPLPTPRAYYRDTLSVAVAIVEQRAVLIESVGGNVRLPSVVVNMNYVFEHYVRNVLRHHASANGWLEQVQDGADGAARKRLFEGTVGPHATPDVVISSPDSATPLVMEVKHVPIKKDDEGRSARSHLNQAVTYAVTYRTRRVVLVHPRASRSQPSGLSLQGVVGDVEVYLYVLDLGAENLGLAEWEFCTAVRSLIG